MYLCMFVCVYIVYVRAILIQTNLTDKASLCISRCSLLHRSIWAFQTEQRWMIMTHPFVLSVSTDEPDQKTCLRYDTLDRARTTLSFPIPHKPRPVPHTTPGHAGRVRAVQRDYHFPHGNHGREVSASSAWTVTATTHALQLCFLSSFGSRTFVLFFFLFP